MESREEIPECLWENVGKSRQVLSPQFLQKPRIVLAVRFCAPPRSSRKERIYSRSPITVGYCCLWSIWLSASVETQGSASWGFHFTLQRVSCLMPWIRSTIARDFSLPPVFAPFAHVPCGITATKVPFTDISPPFSTTERKIFALFST